jgi:predicted MFS family arabinose efflux permease
MIVILVTRFGWFLYFGAYAEHALQASASTLGLAFAAGGVAHLLGSNAAPLLLVRYSPRKIAAAAAGMMALDLLSVGMYSDQAWAMFPFITVFSASWAMCLVSSSILLLDTASTMRNTVTALQSAAMEIGVGAGAAIGGGLLSVFDSYERSFRSLAVLVPVVLLLLVVSAPGREREARGELPVPAHGPSA